ncbi:MAG: nucleoside hydrolase [Bacilli bacterium]|nr:nucleoside hydrolase [Bacilli bacterium]
MRIGLDIDNVITDFDDEILKEFIKYDKTLRNKGIINKNARHINKGMFDMTDEEIENFYVNNMERIAKNLKPRKDCKYYMDKLLNDGHKLYLISHRAYPHYEKPYETTINWLRKNNINYTKLVLSKSTNKSEECKINNIDIMFDDVVSNCLKLRDEKVNVYLMKTGYNEPYKKDLNMVNDWEDLYRKVSTMEKKKVILDTDMENEIDDQFALTYLIKSLDVFDLEAITIAPFSKSGYKKTVTIEEGTEKSYQTTLKLLDMLEKPEYKSIVYKGAINYMKDSEKENDAVNKIIEVANKNEKTTILAIGAITNAALAIKKAPEIINKIKVVWLGGNNFLVNDNSEFNFRQDIKAVQTVFDSGVELVVIPCRGVASHLSTTIYELEHYLSEDTDLNKYLIDIFIKCKKSFMKEPKDEIGTSKILWDLSAIAYEINADWFKSEMISCPNVLDSGLYEQTDKRHNIIFVNDLYRNKIYQDFFIKMGAKYEIK